MALKISDEDSAALPAALDNDTVIFSYGSLLRHRQLRALLKSRGRFRILETGAAAEAARLAQANPQDIVILKNVRLENVRTAIVTGTMLQRWYKRAGGSVETLIKAGVTTSAATRALFLYARAAAPHEKGRILNGGLICNLTEAELAMLDIYEFTPVLKRTRAPELKIGDRSFIPEHITFYAGTVDAADISPEEKAERAQLLNLNRKRGSLSPQACWERGVRRK
jgi:hypothetical protein